jgi:hypothetical protein
MDKSTKSTKEYDLGDVQSVLTVEFIACTENIQLTIYTNSKTGDTPLKNLVRENCTQESNWVMH